MGTERIHSDPKIMLGNPVIRGTPIPVDLLLRKLHDGASFSRSTGTAATG